LGPVTLKGIHQPVQIYECLALDSSGGSKRLVDEGPGYFVSVQPDSMEISKMEEFSELFKALANGRRRSSQ